MKCFLNSRNSSQPANPAEVKAILFAAGACVLFIGFLAAFHRSETRHNRTFVVNDYEASSSSATPVPPVTITEPPPPPRADMNARYRLIPPDFLGINFMTRSYGTYEFSDGTNRDLVLVDGKARYYTDSQQNWFDLNDVVYTDLTGDGNPEAIVLLTHLECGRECDGGKSLLYVYSQNHPIQQILKYESGSGIDGCSLKSIIVANRQLTLDLFGKCPKPAGASTEYVRGKTYDVTRLEFFFNGEQLVLRKTSNLTVPDRDEVSYGVEIKIVDGRPPLRKL